MKKLLILTFAMAALAACGDDDKKSACDRACERIAALDCPNDDPQNVCAAECEAVVAQAPPDCRDEANALITCLGNGEWICDVDGYAAPQATCEAEYAAVEVCAGGMNGVPFGAR